MLLFFKSFARFYARPVLKGNSLQRHVVMILLIPPPIFVAPLFDFFFMLSWLWIKRLSKINWTRPPVYSWNEDGLESGASDTSRRRFHAPRVWRLQQTYNGQVQWSNSSVLVKSKINERNFYKGICCGHWICSGTKIASSAAAVIAD